MFFFVSFGTTVSLGGAVAVLPLLAAILAFYFVLKILVYGAVGSALGLTAQSAVGVGSLMTSIGEFSIIIASAGAVLASTQAAGQELVALAFLLCITTCFIGPLFYAAREKIASLFARLYPRPARDFLHSLATSAEAAESAEEHLFHVGYGRVLRNIAVNFVIALAIVYLSGLFARSFADFPLVGKISLGVVASLLVVWPLFAILAELKNLVHGIIAHALRLGSPYARVSGIPNAAANAFTGLILSALGFGVTALAFFEHANNFLLLAPALYTLLALAYLASSVLSLFGKLKLAGGVAATGAGTAGAAASAAGAGWKRVSEQEHTRRALAQYFARNPPEFGKLGRKASPGKRFKPLPRKQ